MKHIQKNYLLLLWLVGSFLVFYLTEEFYSYMHEISQSTYNSNYQIIPKKILGIIDGVYLGLLLLFINKFIFNKSIFYFVFVPSLILSLFSVVNLYTNLYWNDYIDYFFNTSYFERILGFSLLLSFFNRKE